jgi:hypothetical protein
MTPDAEMALAACWSTKPGVTVNPVWTPAFAAWWMRWTGTYSSDDVEDRRP